MSPSPCCPPPGILPPPPPSPFPHSFSHILPPPPSPSPGITLECDHRFCGGCIEHHFVALIDRRKVKDSDLGCPIPGCGRQCSPYLIKANIPVKSFAKYNRFKIMDEVPNLVTCPRDCGWMCIVEGSVDSVQCKKCDNFSFCSKCECPAHAGKTCAQAKAENDDTEDPEIKAMRIREGWKACPACGEWNCGKKDPDSCDHVKCPSAGCNHEFCFVCLADRKIIYAHGNHFHRPNCKVSVC